MGITSKSALAMRLQRAGQRHKPFYRIVACGRRAPRDGKHFEVIGTYNPIPDSDGNKQVSLNIERIKHWLTHGAQPSERVQKLLGLAELCPPAPRRYVAKQVVGGLDAASLADAIGAAVDDDGVDDVVSDAAEAAGAEPTADGAEGDRPAGA